MSGPEHNPRDDEPIDREEYEAWEARQKATFNEGNRVLYGGGVTPEAGTVIRSNKSYVYVRFDGELHAKACRPQDLEKTA